MRLTRRGRRIALIAGAMAVATTAAVTVSVITRGPSIIVPDDACATPPPLQEWHGVTLQPLAMTAFKEAVRRSGRTIRVVQSYRSCTDQRAACTRVCGDPNGCPDRCARPGTSYHQLGAAVDVTSATLDRSKAVQALLDAGWCQSLPNSDPGHFSYGGCH